MTTHQFIYDGGLDCRHNQEVVCPWCGKTQSDSWEFKTGEYECESETCERPFHVEVEVSVTYSTARIDE